MKGIDYYTNKIIENERIRQDIRVSLTPAEVSIWLHLDPKEHRVSVSLSTYELIRKGNQND